MSYARWDSCTSDVYVFESCHGYEINVATHRKVNHNQPMPMSADYEDRLDYLIDCAAWQRNGVKVAIGLPFDGRCLIYQEPGDCADALENLRDMGYLVPQSAIDGLRKEAM